MNWLLQILVASGPSGLSPKIAISIAPTLNYPRMPPYTKKRMSLRPIILPPKLWFEKLISIGFTLHIIPNQIKLECHNFTIIAVINYFGTIFWYIMYFDVFIILFPNQSIELQSYINADWEKVQLGLFGVKVLPCKKRILPVRSRQHSYSWGPRNRLNHSHILCQNVQGTTLQQQSGSLLIRQALCPRKGLRWPSRPRNILLRSRSSLWSHFTEGLAIERNGVASHHH